jgi:hypothetical protein
VKQFTEAMGGFVFVKSKGIGKGSSFYVCLPHLDKFSLQQTEVNIQQSSFLTKEERTFKSDGTEYSPSFSPKFDKKEERKKVLFAEVT